MTKFISRAFVAALLCASTAAYAGGAVIKISVRYDDLNIAQKSGAQILIARIESASKQACGGTPDIRDLTMHSFFANCVKASMDRAVASINSPEVVAVYNGTAGDDTVQLSQR